MGKSTFFDIVKEPTHFEFKGFNLFKIFYHSFFDRQYKKTDVRWKAMFPSRNKTFRDFLAVLRHIVYLMFAGRVFKRILFYGVSGRVSFMDNIKYDLYNALIVEEEGRDRFVIVEDVEINDDAGKQFMPDFYLADIIQYMNIFLKPIVSVLFRKNIQQYSLNLSGKYPELGFSRVDIESMVVGFYSQYLTWRMLITLLAPERALLLCHYGKESFIAACKKSNVKAIELMHGQILKNHPFYNFPVSYKPFFDKSLFADKLAVYGKHWGQIIVSDNIFPPESAIVVGYYLKVPGKKHNNCGNKKIVVISTQPTVKKELTSYLFFLDSKLDKGEWEVIINTHPAEDIDNYKEFDRPGFTLSPSGNTYELLTKCDIHISVYSTVLFEAVRYDVCNYVLCVERFAQVCKEIIDNGVALPLKMNELPSLQKTSFIDVSQYFEQYTHSLLIN